MGISLGDTELQNGPDAAGIRLQLAEGPLGLAWHHCGTTAEFLGEFFALQQEATGKDRSETRHGVGYLTNELFENAVKFRSPGDIFIASSMEGSRFEIAVTNRIARDVAERFQAVLVDMTTRDPGDLLIERIEANAADPSSSGSGLGLLTLMSDYGARMGWTFEEIPGEAPLVIDTHASLNLY